MLPDAGLGEPVPCGAAKDENEGRAEDDGAADEAATGEAVLDGVPLGMPVPEGITPVPDGAAKPSIPEAKTPVPVACAAASAAVTGQIVVYKSTVSVTTDATAL